MLSSSYHFHVIIIFICFRKFQDHTHGKKWQNVTEIGLKVTKSYGFIIFFSSYGKCWYLKFYYFLFQYLSSCISYIYLLWSRSNPTFGQSIQGWLFFVKPWIQISFFFFMVNFAIYHYHWITFSSTYILWIMKTFKRFLYHYRSKP